MGDDLRRKPYSMSSLDNDWYAVLGGIKRDFWIIDHCIPVQASQQSNRVSFQVTWLDD